jgi:hypothetical protein
MTPATDSTDLRCKFCQKIFNSKRSLARHNANQCDSHRSGKRRKGEPTPEFDLLPSNNDGSPHEHAPAPQSDELGSQQNENPQQSMDPHAVVPPAVEPATAENAAQPSETDPTLPAPAGGADEEDDDYATYKERMLQVAQELNLAVDAEHIDAFIAFIAQLT